jgi:hypothetical protein
VVCNGFAAVFVPQNVANLLGYPPGITIAIDDCGHPKSIFYRRLCCVENPITDVKAGLSTTHREEPGGSLMIGQAASGVQVA